ncbi:MAG: IS1380 family transposase, partial [Sulfuricellaceae bacterium]|nr:IS1380 family transposase [Sulfuricellaceae bacterium]
ASGYEDGNDANTLRSDPLFKLAAERAPLESDNLLACGATHSRLEGSQLENDHSTQRIFVTTQVGSFQLKQ